MPVRIVERAERSSGAAVAPREFQLDIPPEPGRSSRMDRAVAVGSLLPGLGSLFLLFAGGVSPVMRVFGMMAAAGSVGMIIPRWIRSDAHRERERYLAYLRNISDQVAFQNGAEREALNIANPPAAQLQEILSESDRLWERRPGDVDFAVVRYGTGAVPARSPLHRPTTTRLGELDQVCVKAMSDLLARHANVEDTPMVLNLREHPRVVVADTGQQARDVLRALLASLAVLHAPGEMVIAVAAAPRRTSEWDWVKWLPHAQHPTEWDQTGPLRLIATNADDFAWLLADQIRGRDPFRRGIAEAEKSHLIIVCDGVAIPASWSERWPLGIAGVTIFEVNDGSSTATPRTPHLHAARGVVQMAHASVALSGIPEALDPRDAAALARRLAPLRLSGGTGGGELLLPSLGFTDLMGIGDPGSFDTRRGWKRLSPEDRLRVPIGVGENGEPVILDIKEAAMGGMGPHGLCIGATGSGKSEVLRTLVLALAVTHSSENLNFVLSDFKGGATFAGMAEMPHTAAVITNLADDLTMVDRMRDAIVGEMNRRQELLRDGGNFKNIHDYEKARSAGAALTPMPNLMIVLDEFSEMLTAKPEFLDLFIQIGRIGRSLGVHLLLASQRLEEGKLRGLDTYLSYRLGLKTFSAAESRVVLGVPDAFNLPSLPGSGYLKTVGHEGGNPAGTRFKAAYVSGPHRPATHPTMARKLDDRRPALFTSAYQAPPRAQEGQVAAPVAVDDDALVDTVLDVLVRQMERQGPPAHQVWLPPLAEPPTLDALMPGLQVTGQRGLSASQYSGAGRLLVPIGIADKPIEQKRELYQIDLSSAAGHAVVVGGPRTGKSTLARTILMGLALGHTSAEVQFFALDFGGGTLTGLAGLPHISGIGGRLDADVVRRIVSEVVAILDKREESFRRHGIDSIGTFRAQRARGELPDETFGDVFLVIDGWATLRADFELLEQDILEIAQRGLGFGVHVIITAARWAEIRPTLRDLLGTVIELRLGDPFDSMVDRRMAANVPVDKPGRGLTPGRLHFLAALPRIDGVDDDTDLVDGVAKTVHAIADAWQGSAAPKLEVLPSLVPYTRLPPIDTRPAYAVPLGLAETTVEPVYLDFNADPHFLIFGERESGKTSVLRTLVQGITEAYTQQEARILAVDYRRALLDAIPESHKLAYCAAAPAVQSALSEVKPFLDKRQPGPDVTAEQLRTRTWWTGPEIFVIVDDYDLVATQGGNPLLPLSEYLPIARDLGLHLIIARASGGAGRALFEPLIQHLRESRQPGLILSGERDEGQLIGQVRPSRQPPGRGTLISRKHGMTLIQTALIRSQPGLQL